MVAATFARLRREAPVYFDPNSGVWGNQIKNLVENPTRRLDLVFSILDTEWPAVRRHLRFRLESHA